MRNEWKNKYLANWMYEKPRVKGTYFEEGENYKGIVCKYLEMDTQKKRKRPGGHTFSEWPAPTVTLNPHKLMGERGKKKWNCRLLSQ